jgi:hypothetical protein
MENKELYELFKEWLEKEKIRPLSEIKIQEEIELYCMKAYGAGFEVGYKAACTRVWDTVEGAFLEGGV